ncbi:MAG: hypothetical protein ABI665_12655 [Vicinamibacterales bacterium]
MAQRLLQQQYKTLVRTGAPLPSFKEIGFRIYSQADEDGILLYLFSIIEPHNRTCVEIGAGDGFECNTSNLIINHGWWGQLFDGNPLSVGRGKEFFRQHKDTFLHPPGFTHAWITAESVNPLIRDTGAAGQIDLLSLDIDGMDYWIWKALEVVEPAVVVCEIQNFVPPDLAVTIPYRPDFALTNFDDDFRGASLKAMVHLGREKGYRLVGTHRYGFNAFFVKNGVADDLLPEVTPESCATDPYTKLAQQARWARVKDRPWVHV